MLIRLNIIQHQQLLNIVGYLNKCWIMPIGIGVLEQLGEKEELKNLESLGYRFTYPMDMGPIFSMIPLQLFGGKWVILKFLKEIRGYLL